LLGPIGYADAAADVDELEADADGLRDLGCEFEEEPGRLDEIFRVQLVRGHHGMEAESPRSPRLQLPVALEELPAREAILGLLGLADDGVAFLERAGVVPAAYELGYARRLRERLDMRDVIEVDDGARLPSRRELGGGGVVRREHYVLADDPRLPGEDQFGEGARIGA